jgi:hypothetical protein
MRTMRLIGLGALVGLLLLAADSDSYGQRRGGGAVGRGGGAAVGGARGGYVAGPYGGGGGGARAGGTVIGPGGGSASRGAGGGSYTTGRGTTIDYGGAGRAVTGPGGGAAGRGVGGVQVTTPGGRTATKVGTAGGVAGPGGRAAVGGSSVGVANGPRGTAVTGSRGGAALGPGGAVAGGSRGGVAVGAGGGVVAGGVRGGAAVNPYGLSRYSGVRAAGVVGHRTAYVGRTALNTQGAYVRRGFVHYNCFTPAWYSTHVHVWRPVAWTTAAAFWTGAAWATVAATCSYPVEPVIYDYGSTIVYEDNRVYYNGDPIATAVEYTTQATAIAVQGQEAKVSEKDEWVSLGVFGMVQGDEKDANNIFQLAVNKDGVIRGTYYNALDDMESPVSGSVDSKTQRAAWVVGDRKDTVYETGIGNLTEAETTMLVHFGKDRTQQWTLVRLDQPEENK